MTETNTQKTTAFFLVYATTGVLCHKLILCLDLALKDESANYLGKSQ